MWWEPGRGERVGWLWRDERMLQLESTNVHDYFFFFTPLYGDEERSRIEARLLLLFQVAGRERVDHGVCLIFKLPFLFPSFDLLFYFYGKR